MKNVEQDQEAEEICRALMSWAKAFALKQKTDGDGEGTCRVDSMDTAGTTSPGHAGIDRPGSPETHVRIVASPSTSPTTAFAPTAAVPTPSVCVEKPLSYVYTDELKRLRTAAAERDALRLSLDQYENWTPESLADLVVENAGLARRVAEVEADTAKRLGYAGRARDEAVREAAALRSKLAEAERSALAAQTVKEGLLLAVDRLEAELEAANAAPVGVSEAMKDCIELKEYQSISWDGRTPNRWNITFKSEAAARAWQRQRWAAQADLAALSTGSAILMPVAEVEKLRRDRSDALNVKTREGLTCSEWIARTGAAERERDAARRELATATDHLQVLGDVNNKLLRQVHPKYAAQRPGGADAPADYIPTIGDLRILIRGKMRDFDLKAHNDIVEEVARIAFEIIRGWPAPPSHAEARDAIPELTVADVLKGEQEIREGKFVASKPCPSCGKPSLAVALHGGTCYACTNATPAAESAISDADADALEAKFRDAYAQGFAGRRGMPAVVHKAIALLSRDARPVRAVTAEDIPDYMTTGVGVGFRMPPHVREQLADHINARLNAGATEARK